MRGYHVYNKFNASNLLVFRWLACWTQQVLHDEAVEKGGVKYKYLTVKYNTVTRSGYDVERIAYIAATIKRKKLFTLVSTVSGERRYKMETHLDAIRASFRVGDVSTSTPPPPIDT